MYERLRRTTLPCLLALSIVSACSAPLPPSATVPTAVTPASVPPATPTVVTGQPGVSPAPAAAATPISTATVRPSVTSTPLPAGPTSAALPLPTVTAAAAATRSVAPTVAPASDLPLPGGIATPSPFEKTVPPPARTEGSATEADASATAKVQAVQNYYALLARKEFGQAYAALSPAFQKANPFERWSSGYAGLSSLIYSVSANADGSVAVAVTTRESNPGGGEAVREYGGRWLLVFSSAQNTWLLDRAEISRLNK